MTMIFEYFCLTDAGLVRNNNEDAVAYDVQHQMVVLADGMGGYNAGEVASAMAAATVMSEMRRWLSEHARLANQSELRRALQLSLETANQTIFNAANANPHHAGMGTTVVAAVFQDAQILTGHVGDSRCYRWRQGVLTQLTRDHSLLQEQIDAGLISPELALFATHKNLVTRALGAEEQVAVEMNEYRIEAGDRYLFCSDGLNDMISDEHIKTILERSGTLAQTAQALIDAANDSGGRDNVSVILVRVDSTSARKSLFARVLG